MYNQPTNSFQKCLNHLVPAEAQQAPAQAHQAPAAESAAQTAIINMFRPRKDIALAVLCIAETITTYRRHRCLPLL